MPMMSFMTVDLPEPFGPISAMAIWPPRTLSAIPFTATRPLNTRRPETRDERHLSHTGLLFLDRVSGGQKIRREDQHHDERHGEDDEVGQIADRAQRLAHGDNEDRPKHRPEDGTPAAEYRSDDNLHTNRNIDERADRGRTQIEQ